MPFESNFWTGDRILIVYLTLLLNITMKMWIITSFFFFFNRVAMEYWTLAFHPWNVCTAIIYTPLSCCSSSAIISRSVKFVIHTWLLRKGSRKKKPKRCLNWLTKWNKNISMLYQVMWFFLIFLVFLYYLFLFFSFFFILPLFFHYFALVI